MEAGEKMRAEFAKNWKSAKFIVHHVPGLSRTASLNFLVKESQGDLIARVDARTHVDANYLEQLVKLSEESGVANVGG